MKYNIGELEFKTKKAVVDYTRNIINSKGLGNIVKEDEQFKFFSDLLQNHSEYIQKSGVGVESFVIQSNFLYPQHFEMRLIRTDNTTETFSWKHCCEFKPRPALENLTKAMREAVSDTIKAFRKTQDMRCMICEYKSLYPKDFAVDHHKIPFQVLRDDFIKITTISIPTVLGRKDLTNETIFNQDEILFRNEWKKYHDDKATFQMLCNSCNSKKSNTCSC
jgi:hypothetical protein